MDFLSNGVFGKYELIERVGVGGMATVYYAIDTETSDAVALKILHEQWAYDDTVRQRFEFEASIGRKLIHDGIVPIVDYGEAESRPYIAMKYMHGGNLAGKFLTPTSVTLAETSQLLLSLGDALDYAHDKGIIHRDLKLENILLDEQGQPAIADFGIAKLIGTTRLTMTGQFVGTPQYMAPEVLETKSDAQDKYVDLYAFAVMAYLMTTGYFPFTADDPFKLVLKHRREQPPVPSVVKPDLPPRLNEVLLRGLQKKPGDRYFSATEFAQAYVQALENKGRNTTLVFMNKPNPAGSDPGDAINLTNATPMFEGVDTNLQSGNPDTTDFTTDYDTAHADVNTTSEPMILPDQALPQPTSVEQSATTPQANAGDGGRRWIAAMLLLLFMGGSGIVAVMYREPIVFALVGEPDTATPTATRTFTAAPTATITNTYEPSATATDTFTMQADDTATATQTVTQTTMPTNTSSPTMTSTQLPMGTAMSRFGSLTLTPATNTPTPLPIGTGPVELVIPTSTPTPMPTSTPNVTTNNSSSSGSSSGSSGNSSSNNSSNNDNGGNDNGGDNGDGINVPDIDVPDINIPGL